MLLSVLSLPSLLTGCDGAEQEPPAVESGMPVTFGATTLPVRVQTRTGEITTDNITSMGVFASYTGQDDFSDHYSTGSPLNYMYNQEITRANGSSPWTYSPMKYWPNKAEDKITFFAYAPHSNTIKAGALKIPNKTNKGDLFFYYVTPQKAEDQVDLLIATAVNTTKIGTVGLTFRHLTAKVTFQVLSSEDIKVSTIAVDETTTARDFYLGSYGFTWDSAETDRDILPFIAEVNKNALAGNLTDAATFFLLNINTKKEDPVYGFDTSVTLTYAGADNVTQSKTVLLPRGWDAGEAVNFILKLDKVKLDVSATAGGGMTWGGSGTEEEISDSSPII